MLRPNAIFKLGSMKTINMPILIHAIDLAWASTKSEVETHPVEYGLILGSSNLIKSAIPHSGLHGPMLEFLKCDVSDILRSYIGLEGWKTALIVDRENERIEGVLDLGTLNIEDPYEFITGVTSSISVVSRRAYSVRVYNNGKFQIQYIFNRKSGVIEERIPEDFLTLWTGREVNKNIARKMMDACLRISEMRKGALFVIATTSDMHRLSIISHAEPAALKTIYELSASEIINYATRDGATWIDKQGLLRGYEIKFEGPGGRLAIAKSICAENERITTLVVSQDGEINLVYKSNARRLASQITSDNLFFSTQT